MENKRKNYSKETQTPQEIRKFIDNEAQNARVDITRNFNEMYPEDDLSEWETEIDYQIQTIKDVREAEVQSMFWLKNNINPRRLVYFRSGDDIIPTNILGQNTVINLNLQHNRKDGLNVISTNESAPFGKDSMDIVLIDFGFLEDETILRETVRVLKPGGFIFFQKDFMLDGADEEYKKIKKLKENKEGLKLLEIDELEYQGEAVVVKHFMLKK